MATRIALVGMCDKDYVDEIIEEIKNRDARITIEWTSSVWDEVRGELEACIKQNGYARFFMYEKKASGGKGIRVAAHFDSFEKMKKKNCYKGKSCLTRFRVKGYEVFDKPREISLFKEYYSDESLKASQGLGQAFGYVEDPIELKGKDMTVFVKLVWNTDGWQSPSGSVQYPKEELYEADYGFGHEEWNFRAEHAVDGFLYGFMMGKPIRFHKLNQQPFPTYFYSHNGTTFHLVGGYLESEPVGKEEIDQVQAIHSNQGIIKERINEVLAIVETRRAFGDVRNFDKRSRKEKRLLIGKQLGKEEYHARRYLKCPIESAILLQDSIIVDDYLLGMMKERRGFSKYDIPIYIRVYPVVLNKDSFSSEPLIDISEEEIQEVLKESVEGIEEGGTADPHYSSFIRYTLKSGTRKYLRNEFDLVNDFRNWLLSKYSIPSWKESKRIDIRFKHEDVLFGVEAKYSEGRMRFPIRCALGQIIEYNFYPGRIPRNHWIILLNRRPTKEERKWLERVKIGVPISLCWRCMDGFRFESNPFD